MNRPTRSKTFLQIAEVFAERSTCLRGQVGAVIVQHRHIIAHGYNGAPPGQPECIEVGCDLGEFPWRCTEEVKNTGLGSFQEVGCIRSLHAEENAILYAAKVGVNCHGAVMFSTHEPCRQCAKMIAGAGIGAVVWEKDYRLGASAYLDELGILTNRELVESYL